MGVTFILTFVLNSTSICGILVFYCIDNMVIIVHLMFNDNY